ALGRSRSRPPPRAIRAVAREAVGGADHGCCRRCRCRRCGCGAPSPPLICGIIASIRAMDHASLVVQHSDERRSYVTRDIGGATLIVPVTGHVMDLESI